MLFYAIPKRYFSVINSCFDITSLELRSVGSVINPKREFKNEELLALSADQSDEWLVFDSLNHAKMALLMLLRLRTDNSNLVASHVKMFASPVIFTVRGDIGAGAQERSIDATTLAHYPDFQSLPFYKYEGVEREKRYATKILKAMQRDERIKMPRFFKQRVDPTKVVAATFQDATGAFCSIALSQALILRMPARPKVSA